ncbi:transcription elongation factor B polypeptide 3-like isoform X2 [Ostrinia furnacalis]|uniref:transcription elongation factor B polypeptide 3-like isoform X2 n=1 Tax=Ostrinia furnacalis TaxID=93504 RepID=UPI00103F5889|nr:transcription elongation factor B polypeptide 3-like isoform X2 [Ostrinia furnacalis]
MATVLDLVRHYQHSIEKSLKYDNDEQKILKCIDKLFNLDVTVQHLQETGVGRTVNALRKEPGDVGSAARSLVNKWKLMVAAEESDEEDHNNYNASCNGHENGRSDRYEKSSPIVKTEPKLMNGNYSGNKIKRKYNSSEDEEPDRKKTKSSSYGSHDDIKKKSADQVKKERSETRDDSRVKKEQSESDDDSDDSNDSESDNSDSEMSESSEEEKPSKNESKQVTTHNHKSSSSSKQSTHRSPKDSSSNKESTSSKKSHESEKHSKKHHNTENTDKHSSDRHSSKEKSHSSSQKHKSSKENDKSEKSSKSDKNSSEKDRKQKDDPKPTSSASSSLKHKSDSDKHKSSKPDNNVEKQHHSSKSDKHKSSSSSHSQKSEKDKHKSSSEKEISNEKHKSKHGSSSKEKHSSSSKEKSKESSSSSKDKTDSSMKDSHKSEKKHSSLSESKSKHSDSKHKADKRDEGSSESKSKSKSSSSSSHKSKSSSSSSKSKDEVPKKTNQVNSSADSDDGIDCGSGASFAEALGMISPAKPKKKTAPVKETSNSNHNDLSPASLLAPTAKLAPLPAIEISALPEISPNYKPRPPPKLLPHFTDEDAMSMTMSSKNQRTKVYSGNKVIGKIPTLYEMCVQVLQEHIDALEYTGGVPYDILKPVIDRATPQQLFVLEHYNPYLMEDTDHLWQKFCGKNFRNKQRQEMETWREMYMRCQEEQEHRLKSLTANIRIAQEAKKAPIKQTKMAYVDSVVKPPRNIARKQALHGTAHAASASPAARVASLAAAPNVLRGNTRPTPTVTTGSSFKPKKAPLMQKALQFMRGRKR